MTIYDYAAIGTLVALTVWAVATARQAMIRAVEYKHNAQECHEQAKRMLRPEDRDALERVAQLWERLATVREHHPEPELETTKSANALMGLKHLAKHR